MPFENIFEIDVRAFFFNAETDYLPYYKNFTFSLSKESKLKEVLALIKEQNSDFSYPEKDLLFRVNDLIVTGNEIISDVVDELGTTLKIDPALTYRSDNGLILNNSDFMHQYRRIFDHHNTNKEDLTYYINLYPYHYASETFNYNTEYIGDAILLLAHKMITDGSEFKDEILEAINDEFNGIRCCEYENNVFKGVDQSSKINELKAMLTLKEKEWIGDKVGIFINDKFSSLMKKEKIHELDRGLSEYKVAFYTGDKNMNTINKIPTEEIKNRKITLINFEMSTKKAGQTILDSYSELAHNKAGTVLLDALDNGADTFICLKDSDVDYFQSILTDAERIVGRDIELKIVSLTHFQNILKEPKVA